MAPALNTTTLAVEIKDGNILDKATGKSLVTRAANPAWDALRGDPVALKSPKNEGYSYLVSWEARPFEETPRKIPGGIIVHDLVISRSDRAHVYSYKNAIGLFYDLSMGRKCLALVHIWEMVFES